MKRRSNPAIGLKNGISLIVLVMAIALQAGLALAQENLGTTESQNDWAQEIRQNIRQHTEAGSPQQERMMANFERCQQQGMSAEQVRMLFPSDDLAHHDRAMTMLSQQDRILGVSEAGLPIEPMMEKMREGRMKHARPEMMDRVLTTTDHNIRVSDRVLRETVDGGVRMSGHEGETTAAIVDLSRCLWDGLHEQDMEHLGEWARMRARDGDCGLGEFVAANQTATRFAQSGMDRQHAVTMAGEAMRNGYTAHEMHTMGEMMMNGAHTDGDHQRMMNSMDGWIHEGMSLDEMTEHMMAGGWMGPADMMGPGGNHPMSDMGWGGAGHDGGMGGDHGDGGMGDDGMDGGSDHH